MTREISYLVVVKLVIGGVLLTLALTLVECIRGLPFPM